VFFHKAKVLKDYDFTVGREIPYSLQDLCLGLWICCTFLPPELPASAIEFRVEIFSETNMT